MWKTTHEEAVPVEGLSLPGSLEAHPSLSEDRGLKRPFRVSQKVRVQAAPQEGPSCVLVEPWGLPSEAQWLAAERLNLH